MAQAAEAQDHVRRSMWKNIAVTFLCLLVAAPGVVWMHSGLPASLRAHVHMGGFNGELHLFWDGQVYAKGIDLYQAGQSPYSLDDPNDLLPFAYPPVFVWVGAGLARLFPQEVGWNLYIALNVASVFLMQFLLSAVFLRDLKKPEALALGCFAPLCLLATTLFWSGNIHPLWYFAALLAAIPGLRSNRWLLFYGVTVLASLNQPVFVVLLLLPFLAGLRQLPACVATVAIVGGGYVVERRLNPSLYAAFQATVQQHLQASHDYGAGVFGVLATLLEGRTSKAVLIAGALQVMFSAAIFFVLLVWKRRLSKNRLRWWALLAIAVVLVNPRVMMYDAAVAMIPALYLIVCGARFSLRRSEMLRWLSIALVLAVSFGKHRLVGFTLVLIAGFVAGLFAAGEMEAEGAIADASWQVPGEVVAEEV